MWYSYTALIDRSVQCRVIFYLYFQYAELILTSTSIFGQRNLSLSHQQQKQLALMQVAELMAVMAKNRSLSYCKVVEVIAETTAPLTPMEELLAKIPSQRAEIYSPKVIFLPKWVKTLIVFHGHQTCLKDLMIGLSYWSENSSSTGQYFLNLTAKGNLRRMSFTI